VILSSLSSPHVVQSCTMPRSPGLDYSKTLVILKSTPNSYFSLNPNP
jgi:hypothetical protein